MPKNPIESTPQTTEIDQISQPKERKPRRKTAPQTAESFIEQKTNENGEVKNESIEESISNSKNFDELIKVIESSEGIQGSQRFFSKYSLLGRLYLLRSGEVTIDYIPTEILKSKVKEIIEKEKGGEEKPEVEVTKAPTPISIETKPKEETVEDKEKVVMLEKKTEETTIKQEEVKAEPQTENQQGGQIELHEEINKIFYEKIEKLLESITVARTEYGKQIKIKTQHDHTQARIHGLKSRLFQSFQKKENSNEEEFIKAKAEYERRLDEIKNILNDSDLNGDALKKILGLGSDGFEIIIEEKAKLFALINKIILRESNLIQALKEEGLPEGHRKIIARMQKLKKERDSANKFFWRNNIEGNNEEKNA